MEEDTKEEAAANRSTWAQPGAEPGPGLSSRKRGHEEVEEEDEMPEEVKRRLAALQKGSAAGGLD